MQIGLSKRKMKTTIKMPQQNWTKIFHDKRRMKERKRERESERIEIIFDSWIISIILKLSAAMLMNAAQINQSMPIKLQVQRSDETHVD